VGGFGVARDFSLIAVGRRDFGMGEHVAGGVSGVDFGAARDFSLVAIRPRNRC